MKKYCLLLLIMLSLFIITACNKNDDSKTEDPTQEQTPGVTPKEVKYVVTFDIDGVKNAVEVIEGEKVDPYQAPSKNRHIFDGWYNGASLYDFDTPVVSDILLTAKYKSLFDKALFKYEELNSSLNDNRYTFSNYTLSFRKGIKLNMNNNSYILNDNFKIKTFDNINQMDLIVSPNQTQSLYQQIDNNTFIYVLQYGDANISAPDYMNRQDFEDLFVGNMLLRHTNIAQEEITVDKGEDSEYNALALVYTGNAVTWSDECANYLIERGASLDIEGVTLEEYKQTDKYKINGYFELTNLKDETGKMKVNFNDGINSEGSPCESNPFLNFNTIGYSLRDMYGLVAYDENSNGTEEKYNTDILYHGENASPMFELVSAGDVNDKRTNRILYAQPKAGDDKSYYYHTASMSYQNVPVHYDYNGDGKYTSDEKLLWGGYQKREVDEDGNKTWLYDEAGRPIQASLTVNKMHELNEKNKLYDDYYFAIAIKITCNEDSIEFEIINESMIDGDSVGNDFLINELILFAGLSEYGIESKTFNYTDEEKKFILYLK